MTKLHIKNTPQRVTELHKWLDEVKDLLAKKNADYGSDSFDKSIDLFGDLNGLSRIHDKLMRLVNLIKNNKNPTLDESVDDTLKDIVGYCALFATYLAKRDEGCKEIDNG